MTIILTIIVINLGTDISLWVDHVLILVMSTCDIIVLYLLPWPTWPDGAVCPRACGVSPPANTMMEMVGASWLTAVCVSLWL